MAGEEREGFVSATVGHTAGSTALRCFSERGKSMPKSGGMHPVSRFVLALIPVQLWYT
jgi:hypothetical protein